MNEPSSKHIFYSLPAGNQGYADIRTEAIYKVIAKYLSPGEGAILDVACGRGELLKKLSEKGYDTEGLDFDAKCVSISSQYAKCTQGDAYEVNKYFDKESFDLVTCSHFLEHTESPKQYVKKLIFLSRRYVLLVVPNLAQFITIEHHAPEYAKEGHLCGWDPSHFKTFLELHCGLRIIEWVPDQVIIPGRPLWQKVPLFRTMLRFMEVRILTRIFPFVSNSMIVICEKRR